jgi:hypothetical protein
MARARVFIHTSTYEGFGVVCLEALCAGARVVSFVRPMQAHIPNWHFASSAGEMLQITNEILSEPNREHSSIVPYTATDSSSAIMSLFGYGGPVSNADPRSVF